MNISKVSDNLENLGRASLEDIRSLGTLQLKAEANKEKPNEPIFIREDGKIGFSTLNSISYKIGDVIRGKIMNETPSYFMVQVQEIVSKAE